MLSYAPYQFLVLTFWLHNFRFAFSLLPFYNSFIFWSTLRKWFQYSHSGINSEMSPDARTNGFPHFCLKNTDLPTLRYSWPPVFIYPSISSYMTHRYFGMLAKIPNPTRLIEWRSYNSQRLSSKQSNGAVSTPNRVISVKLRKSRWWKGKRERLGSRLSCLLLRDLSLEISI